MRQTKDRAPEAIVQTGSHGHEQLPAVIHPSRDAATDAETNLKVFERWADLIGWRIFGLICLTLMVLQMQGIVATGLPVWVLLALTGAGIGGRQLADIILQTVSVAGYAASAARQGRVGRSTGKIRGR